MPITIIKYKRITVEDAEESILPNPPEDPDKRRKDFLKECKKVLKDQGRKTYKRKKKDK